MSFVMPFVHFPQRPSTLTADLAVAEYEKPRQRSMAAEGSRSPEGWLAPWDLADHTRNVLPSVRGALRLTREAQT